MSKLEHMIGWFGFPFKLKMPPQSFTSGEKENAVVCFEKKFTYQRER